MKLTLSIALTVVWIAIVFVGAGVAINSQSNGSYMATVEHADTVGHIGLVLIPFGALAIIFLIYGQPTKGAKVFELLMSGAVFALQLFIVISEHKFDTRVVVSGRGLLRIAGVLLVGLLFLWSSFWALGPQKRAEQTGRGAP